VKTRTTLPTLFCAIALSGLAYPQQSPQLPAPRPGFSFPQKQTLTYSVDWRVFSAGTAVIHFEAAGEREHINASAETVGAINLLFHASDHFQSVFDRTKGCTYEFDKQTVEGKRQVNSTLRIDYAQSKSILDEKNMVTGQTKHVESPIPGCMTDLLTGVFYASSQPMEVGKSYLVLEHATETRNRLHRVYVIESGQVWIDGHWLSLTDAQTAVLAGVAHAQN